MKPRDAEKGTVAILVAILLPCLFGMAILAIDFGRASILKRRLVNVVDCSALSGAGRFDGSTAGVEAARDRTRALAAANSLPGGGSTRMNQEDVEAGYWDRTRNEFFPEGSSIVVGRGVLGLSSLRTPQFFNAIRAKTKMDGVGEHSPPMPMAFPLVLHELKPGASAVAVGGGACEAEGCMLPIVVPSCSLVDGGGQTECGQVQTLYFNKGTGRDIVLANVLDPNGNVNNNTERDQMAGGVACTNATAQAGDDIRLGNGNDFNSQIASLMSGTVCNAAAPYDGCTKYTLAVSNNGDCNQPMNQTAAVVGFAKVIILRVTPSGTDAGIDVYISCGEKSDKRGGCANFGFGSSRPGLAL